MAIPVQTIVTRPMESALLSAVAFNFTTPLFNQLEDSKREFSDRSYKDRSISLPPNRNCLLAVPHHTAIARYA